jgi:arylsulfatase A-like enzyme
MGLLTLALAGCGRPEHPRSVVLVTIDTLRADHLGFAGYAQPTSPNMDALAAVSTVFDTAVPTCPATAPSVASILTGLHKAAHGVRRNGSALAPAVTTLAERLRAAGWRTLARGTNPVLGTRQGFAQGFDVFLLPAYSNESTAAPAVARDVRVLLDDVGDGPFFLWVHFFDPHGPYVAPKSFEAPFAADAYRRAGETDLPVATSNSGFHVIPRYQALPFLRRPEDYRLRYDAEIRYVDEGVGEVVAALRALGLWDRVVFVLTADHGESLGEHDYYFQHGRLAYDDCLRVPLVIHAPGVPSDGHHVRPSVSLVDVLPTILELVGLPLPDGIAGRSLLPLARGEETADRPAFAQLYYGRHQSAMRLGSMKIIGTTSPDTVEMYDVAKDPGELQDLAPTRTDEAAKLRWQLGAWLVAQRPPSAPSAPDDAASEPAAVDPDLQQKLRTLGYAD